MIKKDIFENFRKKRAEIIQNEIFNLYGIDQQFFIEVLKEEITNPFIHSILENVSEYTLETHILLIGFDNSFAQITNIEENSVVDFRSMNFHAIGSGSIQAVNTLLFQKHSKKDSLLTTIYNVYKAKKNAEVSEGVGRETEILILSEEGVQQLTNENIDILNKIYHGELQYGKNNNELQNISFEEVEEICS